MTDIDTDQLRRGWGRPTGRIYFSPFHPQDLADEIETLRAENTRLRGQVDELRDELCREPAGPDPSCRTCHLLAAQEATARRTAEHAEHTAARHASFIEGLRNLATGPVGLVNLSRLRDALTDYR